MKIKILKTGKWNVGLRLPLKVLTAGEIYDLDETLANQILDVRWGEICEIEKEESPKKEKSPANKMIDIEYVQKPKVKNKKHK